MLVEEDRVTFRVVLVGDSSVGKTSIINRFIHDRFNPSEPNTIGALYDSYSEQRNGQTVDVQIWDTAGTEQYQSLTPVYFRSAAAALVVFDITNPISFASLGKWLSAFRAVATDKAIVFIVGNKVDIEHARKIGKQEAEDWAAERGAEYRETSASTGRGILEMFSGLIDKLVDQSCREAESPGVRQVVDGARDRDARCC
jgi:small GTP-binding protein